MKATEETTTPEVINCNSVSCMSHMSEKERISSSKLNYCGVCRFEDCMNVPVPVYGEVLRRFGNCFDKV